MSFELEKKLWREENAPLGKALGYPDCCINEFCEQPPEYLNKYGITEGDKTRLKAAKINGKFTGFVPCLFHAKQILAGEIELRDLIKDRDIDFLPFPQQWEY